MAMDTVRFTRMEDGTKEEYEFLCAKVEEYARDLPDRILEALQLLKTSYEGYRVSRYEHALQAATRALRAGEDEEMIVATLIHDIGGTLAPYTHDVVAAAILEPFVSSRTCWIIRHHSLFQRYTWAHHMGGDRNARDAYRDHPFYQATVDFCHKYDQCSFDPDYDSLPIEVFEPMVRRIFTQPRPGHQFTSDET